MAMPLIPSRPRSLPLTDPRPADERHLQLTDKDYSMTSSTGAHFSSYLHGPFRAVSHLLQCDGCQKTFVAQKQLSERLAELAEGTTIMGRPRRTEHRYGVIGDHRNIVTTWPPVLTQCSSHRGMQGKKPRSHVAFQHSTPGVTTPTSPATSESIDSNPVISRRVTEDLLPLAPTLTKLYASTFSFDDKNEPPSSSIPDMKLGSASCGTDCLQRRIRTEFVPLAVLQNFKSKGWARLHPKAPPAINTTLANAAPNA